MGNIQRGQNAEYTRVVYVRRLCAPRGIRYRGDVMAMGSRGDYLCSANACLWIEAPLLFAQHYAMFWKMQDGMYFCTTPAAVTEIRQDAQVRHGTKEHPEVMYGQRGDEIVTYASGASFLLRRAPGAKNGACDAFPLHVDTRRQSIVEIT